MISEQAITAIIPARGGSKRFPGKNIQAFLGKPLITHSILYALQSELITSVYVSTDNSEIAEISRKSGAMVLDRPSHLASDTASTAEVVQYHCTQWKEQGNLPDWIVLLQPTNPIRPPQLLKESFSMLDRSQRSSLVTFSKLNRKFGLIRDAHYIPENYAFGQRMQDIEPRYFENGLLYIVKGELALQGNLFGPDPYPFLIDSLEAVIDIDEPSDLVLAEAICKLAKF